MAYKNALKAISSYMAGLNAVKKQDKVMLRLGESLLSKILIIPNNIPHKMPITILVKIEDMDLFFNSVILFFSYLLKMLKEAIAHKKVMVQVCTEENDIP